MADSLTHALLAGIGLMVAFDVLGYQPVAAVVAAVFLVGLLALGVFKLMQLQSTSAGRGHHDA